MARHRLESTAGMHGIRKLEAERNAKDQKKREMRRADKPPKERCQYAK
jgi:hypothetical protein